MKKRQHCWTVALFKHEKYTAWYRFALACDDMPTLLRIKPHTRLQHPQSIKEGFFKKRAGGPSGSIVWGVYATCLILQSVGVLKKCNLKTAED